MAALPFAIHAFGKRELVMVCFSTLPDKTGLSKAGGGCLGPGIPNSGGGAFGRGPPVAAEIDEDGSPDSITT